MPISRRQSWQPWTTKDPASETTPEQNLRVRVVSGRATSDLIRARRSAAIQANLLFRRRFGVKDSSHVIPGHGGLLDRLDGFVAAIIVAAIFGFLRGGADGVGRGLMVW